MRSPRVRFFAIPLGKLKLGFVETTTRCNKILVCGLILTSFLAFSNGKEVSAASTLTMTIDNSLINLNLIPREGGAFAKSSNSTVSVTTNNYTGYTLSIVADSSANLSDGSGHTLDSISSEITENAFSDGSAYNGKCGYLPSKKNSSANTKFQPLPSTSGDILDVTRSANASANNYTLAIGARADLSTTPGAYSNTFVVVAVANLINYSISYDANTSDSVANMPTSQSGSVDNSTATVALRSNTPSRSNYEFIGWCRGSVQYGECNGTLYNPGGNYTINHTGSNYITLYAVWRSSTIQDMSFGECDATATTARTVYDLRDGQQYRVMSLEDGNCWLLDNLRLDPRASGTTLTPNNTNATDRAINNYLNGGGGKTGWSTTGVSTSWSGSYTAPVIYNTIKNTTAPAASGVASTKAGIYYNYCAATVGTYCYASNGGANVDIEDDVCPVGWRMPTKSEYDGVLTAYSNNITNAMVALSTPYSGVWTGGNNYPDAWGNAGGFWSSTNYAADSMYGLIVTQSSFADTDTLRLYGAPVRCIKVTPDINNLTYLQDFYSLPADDKNDVIDSMNYETVYTLKDMRDEEEYGIVRLLDERVWVIDNLRFDPISMGSTMNEYNTNASAAAIYNYLNGGGGQYGWSNYAVSGSWSDSYDLPKVYNNVRNNVAPVYYGNGYGKVGVYYNYCAATVGTYCYPDNVINTDKIENDICPAGWRIPERSEYDVLSGVEPNVQSYREDLSLPQSGAYYSGNLNNLGDFGVFWSSTNTSNSSVNYLYVDSSTISTPDDGYRSLGLSTRCILK